MSTGDLSKVTDADLDREIEALKTAAARALDPCLTAKCIALSDQRVRALFLKKLQHGYVFRGISCLDLISVPENQYVYFDFDCKPGTLCLVKPAFLAVVNIVAGYVVAIVDPYIASAFGVMAPVVRRPSDTRGARTYLVLANHTFRDIHIQVTGDVHTGNWGPNQVNHGEEPEVKSERIDFGDEATYHIHVWKNDGGRQGEFLGDFYHQVRYNTGGNRDHLEFTIVDVDGQTYLRAFSVRRAIEVALLAWLGGERSPNRLAASMHLTK